MFEKWSNVIACLFCNVCTSNVEARQIFDFTVGIKILQKLRVTTLDSNAVIEEDVDYTIDADIITLIDSPWSSSVLVQLKYWQTKVLLGIFTIECNHVS